MGTMYYGVFQSVRTGSKTVDVLATIHDVETARFARMSEKHLMNRIVHNSGVDESQARNLEALDLRMSLIQSWGPAGGVQVC